MLSFRAAFGGESVVFRRYTVVHSVSLLLGNRRLRNAQGVQKTVVDDVVNVVNIAKKSRCNTKCRLFDEK